MKWFWEVIEKEFSDQDRENLWTFISGSKGVPPGGFASLVGVQGRSAYFTITKNSADSYHLPVAHTCTFQLELRKYPSKAVLLERLRTVLCNTEGFGLI